MTSKSIQYASYTQISPERDITSSAFSKGQINFRLDLASMSRWNPQKSYIRMRIRMKNGAGNALTVRDGIAPNMNQGHDFWQQMNISCNGVKVSEIDDYYIQVASLKERMVYDQSRRDTMLANTNFAQSSIDDRIAEVSQYGFDKNEPNWIPFTDLFNTVGVPILINETVAVAGGGLSVINYAGAIDLTQTDLSIGDHVQFTAQPGVYQTRRIVAIAAATITVDRDFSAAIGPLNIEAVVNARKNTIYYSKAKPARRVSDYELCFRPCLAFFDLDEYLPGNYKLELTPHTDLKYQRYAIESLADAAPNVNYQLEIIDLQFYAWVGRATSPMTKTAHYGYSETRCQAQTITNASLLNKCFIVNPNSHMFCIAYQKADAGDNTSFSKAKFKMINEYEKRLSRYQLRIGGETLPTPLPQINTDPNNNIDYATQQYYEQLMYNKSFYLSDPESLTEWFERGPFYCYVMPKRLNSQQNRLYVSQEFNDASPENFLLLVFDTYYTGFSIVIDNGLITRCERDSIRD